MWVSLMHRFARGGNKRAGTESGESQQTVQSSHRRDSLISLLTGRASNLKLRETMSEGQLYCHTSFSHQSQEKNMIADIY